MAFFIKIIPNRRADTFRGVIRKHFLPNTMVLTDSHRSYPTAKKQCNNEYTMNLTH